MATGGYFANNINYTILNGYPPFNVELKNSGLPINTHTEFGTYTFSGITAGTYILSVVDSKNCVIENEIIFDVDPCLNSFLGFMNINLTEVKNIECNLSVSIASPYPNMLVLDNFVSSDPDNANYRIEIFKDGIIVLSDTFTGGTPYFANDLTSGDYSVVVTDLTTSNCTVTLMTTVNGIGFNDTVTVVTLSNDGTKYLFGGEFTKYGNDVVNGLVMLDSNFNNYIYFNSGSGLNEGMYVRGIEPMYGNLYYMFQNGQYYDDNFCANGIFALAENGSVDISGFSGTPHFADGPIEFFKSINGVNFIGGTFNSYGSLVALDYYGNLLPYFNVGSGFKRSDNSAGTTLCCYSFNGDEILVGGMFETYSGVSSLGLVLIDVNGNLLSNGNITNSIFDGYVHSMCEASNGGVFIGGSFTRFKNVNRYKLFKLDSNYNIDNNFNVARGDVEDYSFNIYATSDGGCFTRTGLYTFKKFNADGSVDLNFNSSDFNGSVIDYIETPDNRFILVGDFTTFKKQQTNRCVVLNNDGTVFKLFI